MSNDHDKVNETTKIKNLKICGGGLNARQSPSHPPSKKTAITDPSQEGLEELEKGGTVVHG